MLRSALLWLSEHPKVFRAVRTSGILQRLASRFVAGETEEAALATARALNARGIRATLDFLGESVSQEAEAGRARDVYLRLLEGLHAAGLEGNVSLKLTQMGFDLGEALCADNLQRILERARTLRSFVRIDMESSAYTGRTLDFFEQRFLEPFRDTTGVVIQSCLRRSADDVERLIRLGVRVRLCKGAYLEPPEVAFPAKAEVDASYRRLMERLLEAGHFPAIATHDVRMIGHARAFATARGIGPDRFEFQMLHGVRRDLQEALRRQGYRVRVYVPFGTQWYPYLMRRLAERPANVAFMVGNLVREGVRRKG